MPFKRRGPVALVERMNLRMSPEEKEDLNRVAASAGLTVSELVRARSLGRPVVSRTDATTIRELRRLGGLLKHIHTESAGAYSQETSAALTELRAAITRLGSG